MWFMDAARTGVLAAAVAGLAACTAGCGSPAGAGSATPTPHPSTTAAPSPTGVTAAANPYGSFTLAGWVNAAGVGPVSPLPFATLTGAVPGVPLGQDSSGRTLSGVAPGTQCAHATSAINVDQYQVLLVFEVRGHRYRLSVAAEFGRPGMGGGEATPPAGGRMSDATGGADELRFDPEGVLLAQDPMFVGSFSDGAVVIAPSLRSGSIDAVLHGLPTADGTHSTIHVTGTWTCP